MPVAYEWEQIFKLTEKLCTLYTQHLINDTEKKLRLKTTQMEDYITYKISNNCLLISEV